MDILDTLENQHREVDSLFEKFSSTTGTSENRRDTLDTLLQTLSAHLRSEEQVFYPAARQVDVQQIRDSVKEHHEIQDVIETIRGKTALAKKHTPSDLVEKLKHLVMNHVQEEETILFPALREEMDLKRRDVLNTSYLECFQRNFEDMITPISGNISRPRASERPTHHPV